MFIWNDFKTIAQETAVTFLNSDSHLVRILAAETPAAERTDEIGRPIPGSVGIHEHPDIANFKRALAIRKELAEKSRNFSYVSYADSVLNFIEKLPVDAEVFIVMVATKGATYEFFYAPQLRRIIVSEVAI